MEKYDNNRYTPLLVAAESGVNKVVKALIAKGANKDHVNKSNQTPLMMAVVRKRLNIVKMLVKSGADVNIRDCHGYTPLARAVQRGCVDIAINLMKEGNANMDTCTKQGYTLMDLAEKCKQSATFAMKKEIFDEQERRKAGQNRVDDETTQPPAKKQRITEEGEGGKEAGGIGNID